MALIADRVLDLGLNVLDTEATHIYVTSAEATTYTEATSTFALGNKNFGAGAAFGAPANGVTNGRRTSSVAITDGTNTASGTATHWAATDNTNSRLLAAGPLAASVSLTSGGTFSLTSFDVTIPDAA